LNILSHEKKIGRKKLAEKVGIGEGSIRTILAVLRRDKLVKITQNGISLSSKGEEELRAYPIKMVDIDANEMTIGSCDIAVHVKNAAHKIKDGLEQRDEAIKVGAKGATTIICKDRRLIIPLELDIRIKFPVIEKRLRELFDLKDEDVIIIGTADSREKAEDGALAAAFALITET
jgi:DNA-binding transcriptional regulator LsrR (DeoR family)